MASVVRAERRHDHRCAGGGVRWRADAVIRPGVPVVVVNICRRAALVESVARLRPGAHTELHLAGAGGRASIRGRLDRCYVATLEPIRYRGVMIFEQGLELGQAQGSDRE